MQSTGKILDANPVVGIGSDRGSATKSRPEVRRRAQKSDLNDVIQQLTHAMQMTHTKLSFSVDEVDGQVIVRVTDEASGKVIRQIPSDEMLRVAKNVKSLMGLLCDHAF